MMKKPGKLDKLMMPKRKKPEDSMSVMELELEAEPEEDSDLANEMEGEAEAESDGSEMSSESLDEGPLTDASDDELMAELKRRGLQGKLAGNKPPRKSQDDSEY